MVLKAKVVDNFSYFYVDGKVFRYCGVVDIPDEFMSEFDCSFSECIENCNFILKDFVPDRYIAEKPLIDYVVEDCGWVCSDGKGYCKTSALRSDTGTWVICANSVVYSYKSEVRVLKRGNCRHRKDYECEELKVNLKTGESKLTQKFFDKGMVISQFVFNKDTREWDLVERTVDSDILGIKRI